MSIKNINLPDIGGFDAVEIIELHVAVGDKVNKEDPIVTLESDKATMDIPSPFDGKIKDDSIDGAVSFASERGSIDFPWHAKRD